MRENQLDQCFAGSTADPSRAEPVSRSEYHRLCAALETVVLPGLMEAATTLVLNSFQITKMDAWGAIVSLAVKHRRVEMEALLQFQNPESFGPLTGSEPVLWMYSLRRDGNVDAEESGRLRDLRDRDAVQVIVSRFVQRCLSVSGDGALRDGNETQVSFA